ncbi:MAG TPA: helix-turn-helix domain-containing protein [Actinoplanes sp.]|nr:helix-turn-helix domain-containing protein [Actinoplanes sp.]
MIGLVVHASHRARFADAASTLTGIDFAWAVYAREDEVRDRVTGLLRDHHLDGLLLGLVPFARARDLIPADLPFSVTRSAALDLALAWARARGNGWPATPVSIDTFATETVDEVASALGLDRSAISALPFEPDQSIDEVVGFHRQHLSRTGAPYVISVRTGVASALDGQTPVLHALATPGTIRADLHELALRIRTRRADGHRFAAGVFLAREQERQPALQRLLAESPEFADAWIGRHGDRGVLVLAPASLFETATDQWVGLPLLNEANAVAGFGIGGSARLSVALAERAAARAEQDRITAHTGRHRVIIRTGPEDTAGQDQADTAEQDHADADGQISDDARGQGGQGRDGNPAASRASASLRQEPGFGAYLFTGDGMTIGPIGGTRMSLTYTYRDHGPLEQLARRAGLSPATLSRLASIERSLDGRPVSPGELARSLGVTDPSGRRLIRKLTAAGLVEETGSAQESRKGRPTRLYRLSITGSL